MIYAEEKFCEAAKTLPDPVYQDNLVTLYCGDCAEIAPLLPRFDLLLTDPPYGIGLTTKRSTVGSHPSLKSRRTGFAAKARLTEFRRAEWDSAPADVGLIQSLIARARRSIIWGGGHIGLPGTPAWLVWDKKNDGTDFSHAEMAWTNLPAKGVRLFRFRWSGCLQEDMKNKEKRIHPAQKPVPLMEWCLQKAKVKPDWTVFDPFCGSGSTLIAARKMGLRAIGVEKCPLNAADAANRLQATSPLNPLPTR